MPSDSAKTYFETYLQTLFDTDKQAALQLIQNALEGGVSPEDIVFDIVVPGLEMMVGGMISEKTGHSFSTFPGRTNSGGSG